MLRASALRGPAIAHERALDEVAVAEPHGSDAEVNELLSAVSREATIAGVAAAVVSGAVKKLGAGSAALYVSSPQQRALRLAAWHAIDARLPMPTETIPLHAANLAVEVGRERGGRLVRAAEIDPSLPASAGVYAAPLIGDGGVIGLLMIGYASPASPAQLHAAGSIIAPVSAFLDRAELLAERAPAPAHALEQVLERTEKLRALGEMAAGISHDFRNLLAPLSLHIQLLRHTMQRGAPAADGVLDEMEHVIARAVDTLNRFREFSRTSGGADARIEVDAAVREAVELARPLLSARSSRVRGLALVEHLEGPPAVEVRSSDLVTALLNLVANAIEAIGDGGTITISSGSAGGGAWVRVADDGPGIPAELRERIFEPFFTTKGASGTGLGLHIVKTLAERHRGTLTLESGEAAGASFRLWLPCAAAGGPSVA